jgi:hypothetical protein
MDGAEGEMDTAAGCSRCVVRPIDDGDSLVLINSQAALHRVSADSAPVTRRTLSVAHPWQPHRLPSSFPPSIAPTSLNRTSPRATPIAGLHTPCPAVQPAQRRSYRVHLASLVKVRCIRALVARAPSQPSLHVNRALVVRSFG